MCCKFTNSLGKTLWKKKIGKRGALFWSLLLKKHSLDGVIATVSKLIGILGIWTNGKKCKVIFLVKKKKTVGE